MDDAAGTFVTLKIADGTSMRAYVARPDGTGRHPGIMVFQEAFGVNGHIRDVAGRFAAEGYVAIAPELFHRTAPGFEGLYTDFEAVRPHLSALTAEGLEADILATFDFLVSDAGTDPANIVSIGFCMGGRVSFIANSIVPVKAAASFYGGGIAPRYLVRAAQLHAPMMFFWGGLDKNIGPDQIGAVIGALRTAGKPYVNIEFSDANHGFFCDARASYNANAARQAWSLVRSFLAVHLGP